MLMQTLQEAQQQQHMLCARACTQHILSRGSSSPCACPVLALQPHQGHLQKKGMVSMVQTPAQPLYMPVHIEQLQHSLHPEM